jgi:hypothetical protein
MPNGVLKLSVNLGKKTAANPSGECLAHVTTSSDFRAQLLSLVQSNLDNLVASDLPVTNQRCTRREYEAVNGLALGMNGGTIRTAKKKKKKPKKDSDGNVIPEPPYDAGDDVFYVTRVDGVAYGVGMSPSAGRTGAAGRITVATGEKDSQVTVGRYIEVVVKVQCEVQDWEGGEVEEGIVGGGWETEVDGSMGEGGEVLMRKEVEEIAEKVEEMEVKEVKGEMVVNPWDVSGKIDYNKLVEQFGSVRIDEAMLERLLATVKKIGKVTELHPWIRRGIFFSHRDLSRILDLVDAGKPFYLYTGRGPSSAAMHLGHLVPFMMTAWLQRAFDVPLVVQMTDDEKFIWKGEYKDGDDNLDYFRGLTRENARDIISCGFIKEKVRNIASCFP